MDTKLFTDCREKLISNCSKVIVGKNDTVEQIIICLIASGHVLLEDLILIAEIQTGEESREDEQDHAADQAQGDSQSHRCDLKIVQGVSVFLREEYSGHDPHGVGCAEIQEAEKIQQVVLHSVDGYDRTCESCGKDVVDYDSCDRDGDLVHSID